jgi:hypothetical protein
MKNEQLAKTMLLKLVTLDDYGLAVRYVEYQLMDLPSEDRNEILELIAQGDSRFRETGEIYRIPVDVEKSVTCNNRIYVKGNVLQEALKNNYKVELVISKTEESL